MTELDSPAISSPEAAASGLMASRTFGNTPIHAPFFFGSSTATNMRKVNIRVTDDAASAAR